MKRLVYVADDPIWIDDSMSWIRIFKSVFDEDALFSLYKQLFAIVPALDEQETENVDEQFLLRVFWSMAKNADPQILDHDQYFADYQTFNFPTDLLKILLKSSLPTSNDDKPAAKQKGSNTATTEDLIATGLKSGLCIADTHDMTLREWMDVIAAYWPELGSSNSGDVVERIATQDDFDRFKRG